MNLKFLSIRRISYNLAWYISNFQSQNHNQRYIYYYALQAVIGETTKTTIILLISLTMGIFKEALTCMIVFSSIRLFGGGFHADSNIKCFLYTLSIVLCICLSSILFLNYFSSLIPYLNLLLFIITFYLLLKLAPGENHNKPIISDIYRKELKIKTLIICAFWFALSIILLFNINYHQFVSIITISAFIEAVTLTKWFLNLTNKIEKLCAKLFCAQL